MRSALKWLALLAAVLVVAVVAIGVWDNLPRWKNLGAEYGTGQAIGEIDAFLIENDGRWPSSPEHLGNRYPMGGIVRIDYSVSSSELIEDPSRLREAVRPESGIFYTYPHYQDQLDVLAETLRETNSRL